MVGDVIRRLSFSQTPTVSFGISFFIFSFFYFLTFLTYNIISSFFFFESSLLYNVIIPHTCFLLLSFFNLYYLAKWNRSGVLFCLMSFYSILAFSGMYDFKHLYSAHINKTISNNIHHYPIDSRQYQLLNNIIMEHDIEAYQHIQPDDFVEERIENINKMIAFFEANPSSELISIRQTFIALLKQPYLSKKDFMDFEQSLDILLKANVRFSSLYYKNKE